MWHFDTSVDSDELVQPPFKLRNCKCCLVSRLALLEYSKVLGLCVCAGWSLVGIPHCWKSYVAAHILEKRIIESVYNNTTRASDFFQDSKI